MVQKEHPNRMAVWRVAAAVSLLGVSAVLAGCANMGGPAVQTDMTGEHAYRIHGAYTSVSDTAAVLKKQMTQAANEKCPTGWKIDAEGPNNTAMSGGQVWQIHCTGVTPAPRYAAAQSASSPAPQPVAVQMAPPPKNKEEVLRIMTAAALGAAPGLSNQAARAVAEAQLRGLEAAGVTLTDAKGKALLSKKK